MTTPRDIQPLVDSTDDNIVDDQTSDEKGESPDQDFSIYKDSNAPVDD